MTAKTFGRVMIAPATALFLAVGTGPLLYALYASAHSFPAEADAAPEWKGAGNFVDLSRDPQFLKSVGVTGMVLVLAVTAQLVLGFALAMALHRVRRGRGLVVSLLLIPSAIAPIVAGI
ncbi:MAG TPA: hypothetical protein VN539_02395, partial [Candidatus Saccharimonadales bacterium]|nr:hypothetical protein [Candidatus Saccharimonadales bacterium]